MYSVLNIFTNFIDVSQYLKLNVSKDHDELHGLQSPEIEIDNLLNIHDSNSGKLSE